MEFLVDQNVEKAFEISNLMVTVANQKKVLKEEYEQSLFFFENGGVFKADESVICYVKNLKELLQENRAVIIDFNRTPIEITDLSKFLESLLNVHFQANNAYFSKFETLKKSKNIKSILSL